jgi:hypothetical protein
VLEFGQFRKVGQIAVRFEMWRWRRTEKTSGTDLVNNEVLHAVKEERNILHAVTEGRLTRWVTSCVGAAF